MLVESHLKKSSSFPNIYWQTEIKVFFSLFITLKSMSKQIRLGVILGNIKAN